MEQQKTLTHILMHIGHLLEGHIREQLSDLELAHGQARVLTILLRTGPITQAALARGMEIAAATMTNMLKPLAKRGLIDRRLDPRTNRARIVSLTTGGRALAEAAQGGWWRVEERLRKVIPDESIDPLLAYLEALRAALGGGNVEFEPYETDEE